MIAASNFSTLRRLHPNIQIIAVLASKKQSQCQETPLVPPCWESCSSCTAACNPLLVSGQASSEHHQAHQFSIT